MSIEAMSKAYEALNKSRPFDADNARMQRDAMDALRTAIQQATQPAEVTDSMIREAFLTNGFTIKDGHSDLKPYVYAAARAILALRPQASEKLVPMPHRHYSEALADDLIASGDVESVIASHSEKETPWPHN